MVLATKKEVHGGLKERAKLYRDEAFGTGVSMLDVVCGFILLA